MRWRCAAGIFQRNAVFSRRTSALLHLTICFSRIRWCKQITPRGTLPGPGITWKKLDSGRCGTGIRLCVTRDDLRASNISHTKFSKLAKLDKQFHEVAARDITLGQRCVLYEQKTPITYTRRPSDRLHDLVKLISPQLWSIIRSTPPYRRYYLNLLSPSDRRVHPLISIYLLCFYLGSVTRYRPHEFEKVQQSKYGMFVAEFLETEGLQFWYKVACEFGQQNVSLPAVVH